MTAFLPDLTGIETTWPLALAALALGYLLGSIPFGLLITRALGLGDVRKIGSGNIGATNVLRTGHKGAAAATLFLDAFKGFVAVWAAWEWLGAFPCQLAGLGAFLGHLFPVWLGFRGGKGVATFLGILWGLMAAIGVLACLVWLSVAVTTRYSSLSALLMALAAPVFVFMSGARDALWLCLILTLLIWWTHRANIARLVAGTEPKIGRKPPA